VRWNFCSYFDTQFFLFFSVALQPNAGYGLILGLEITHNVAPQMVGLLRTSDQPVAETSTRQHITIATNFHDLTILKPTTSKGKRPLTYAVDRTTTGSGRNGYFVDNIYSLISKVAYIGLVLIHRRPISDRYFCTNAD
jgi:hypothetical protein